MRVGAVDSDAYLEGWRRADWVAADGTPAEVAAGVAARLEAELTAERVERMLEDLHVNLYELLASERVVLADGGMGTMLQEVGLDAGEAPRAVERRAPGGDRGHPGGLRRTPARTTSRRTRSAARAPARDARPRRPRPRAERGAAPRSRAASPIATASSSPATSARPASCSPRSARSSRRRPRRSSPSRSTGSSTGGIDFVLIETMSDLAEAEAAVRGGPPRRAGPAGRRHDELRHERPHDDRRHAEGRRRRVSRRSASRRRRQLRPRPGGDARRSLAEMQEAPPGRRAT